MDFLGSEVRREQAQHTDSLFARGGFFDQKEFEVNGLGECFHAFELHPSLVALNSAERVDELLAEAKKTGTTVESLARKDPDFAAKSALFEKNLNFNLEKLFADSIITDRAIALKWKELGEIRNVEEGADRFVAAWEAMQNFYSIEGFVGSFNLAGSVESGILDMLENLNLLTGIDAKSEKGKEILLCLASVVGRDFEEMTHITEVLRSIHGCKEVDADEVLKLVKEVRNTDFKTNGEISSFFNSLIRFHNWTRLRLKSGDSLGDTFDSVCSPAKTIAEMAGNAEVLGIKDATSPKGIATVRLLEKVMDERTMNAKASNVHRLKKELLDAKEKSMEDFVIINPEDSFFPNSLVGGKAQGLKSVKEAIEVLGLNLQVPRFVVISSVGLERQSLLKRKLKDTDFSWVGISRSSAIGEDSHSNFAGVFESVPIDKKTKLESAISQVVRSFTAENAGRMKEEIGIPKDALGGVVLQERVAGQGIVLFIRDEVDASLSFADTPEAAVNGSGKEFSGTLGEVLEKAGLGNAKADLLKLFDTFGPIDLELVKNGRLNVVQMRRMAKASNAVQFPSDVEKVEVQDIHSIKELLRQKAIISVDACLNADKEHAVELIFGNKDNIAGIESRDNITSHMANLIMGLGIPFRQLKR